MAKNLFPSLTVVPHIDKKTKKAELAMYRQGGPRQYRFNASTGIVNIKGRELVTKAGQDLQLIVLAVRVFRDNLFNKGRKNWAELFFLNQDNQVCSILFHGYSVENFTDLEEDLFYAKKRIDEVVLTVSFEKKESTTAKGSTYYIASFDFDAAEKEVLEVHRDATKDYLLYRSDTWNEDARLIVGHNYPQAQIIDMIGAKNLEAGKEEETTEKTEGEKS